MSVETSIVSLPELQVPVTVEDRHLWTISAGLEQTALSQVWTAVSEAVKSTTDWWWVIYPSNVPEQFPDFAEQEFLTGGMDAGPDGASPVFVIDDRWLIRKPAPFLGKRDYSLEERWAYLPQWFQHEFFHYLFRIYPEFRLEQTDHQWFDRRAWPGDFEGRWESDYFSESLHRILRFADPPLESKLHYSAGTKSSEPRTIGAPDDEQAIRNLVAEFSAARSARDPKRLSLFYAENAEFIPFGGSLIKGRAAIEKVWTPVPDVQTVRTIRSIRFIQPGEAAVQLEGRIMSPADDFKWLDDFLVTKALDHWKIKVHRSLQR
ncbi:MAG TPA: SgcJ/EcaC family oxidoreductase [Bryobacteraceae bacterium]|nr:SgcJ/EcaC family oxidoreductase [Bryobacteraceae bacterium]